MPRKAKETIKKDTIEQTVISPKKEKKTSTKSKLQESKKGASDKTLAKKKQTTTKKKTSTSSTKSSTKKVTTPKTKQTKHSSILPMQDFQIEEYYDLPYRYGQTTVKILAQTPTTLFIYWEIADDFIKQCTKQYGEHFFKETKPVLVIHNQTKHYSFEVEINDFANCWYLKIADSNCKYKIELGRRPKQDSKLLIPNNFFPISSSNEIESPNDHILFDFYQNNVYFRNVKTNVKKAKPISHFSFMKRVGTLQKFYQTLYKEDIAQLNDLSNPSSQNPTSTFH